MKTIRKPILISFLLSLLILVFPILSGDYVTVKGISGQSIYLIQGIFFY